MYDASTSSARLGWRGILESGQSHLHRGTSARRAVATTCTQAVARLMLDNVDHVGASWVTQGPAVGQVALRFGADDFAQ
jgi:2-iminoacetate synthase ThiH